VTAGRASSFDGGSSPSSASGCGTSGAALALAASAAAPAANPKASSESGGVPSHHPFLACRGPGRVHKTSNQGKFLGPPHPKLTHSHKLQIPGLFLASWVIRSLCASCWKSFQQCHSEPTAPLRRAARTRGAEHLNEVGGYRYDGPQDEDGSTRTGSRVR
jgi:hypothetical protein